MPFKRHFQIGGDGAPPRLGRNMAKWVLGRCRVFGGCTEVTVLRSEDASHGHVGIYTYVSHASSRCSKQ